MAQISVYKNNETNFTHNGIVLSETVYCVIEEELNGKYVLELTHPIDDKGRWQDLTEENIIKADGQLFRIHATEKDLNYVYVLARHIFYDLLHNFLEDVRPTSINGGGALNWILTNTQYPHNFIGMSDIERLNTQYYIRKNPVEAMLGADSLVSRWGGELVRDNFQIRLLSKMGDNKGAQIAYGKNMLGLDVTKNMDTVMTRIMPLGTNELTLPEKYIDSPLIENYTFPYIRKVEFDIGIDDETTEAQAYEKLRQGVKNLYEINKVDIPYVNIKADLILLENTEEYKHIKNLIKVGLGDIVSCTDNPLGITFKSKVIRVKKDVLNNRNIEVELGQFKKGLSNAIQDAIEDVSEEIKRNTSDLEKAINNATELLTSALGGYVVKRPGELLIMDTEDINTATKVWRWNLNGLGYSDVGVNGPYRLAITMDGQMVADFITTGTLNAGLIKTGVLMSKDSKTWINMDDGSFNFKDQLVWDSSRDKLILGPKTEITWNSVTSKPDIEGIVNGAVGGIEIGGRNLILNSKGFKTTDGYLLATYNMSEDWELDTEYTITIKGTVNSGQQFGIWLNGDQTNGTMFTPDSSDITKHTFRTPSQIINNVPKLMAIYNYPSPHATSSYIEWIKLERGNQATDWTPAPEDVEQLIPTDGYITTITKNNVTTEFINAMEIIAKYVSASAVINIGDKTSGNYIEISPDNPVKVWRNNVLVSSLGYSEIGGGNLTIYDRYGAKAFWAECLADGDFKMFFNNDTAMIPDPEHPGFWIPNRNSRKAWIEAGNVMFTGTPRVYKSEGLTPYLVDSSEFFSLKMEVNSLKSSLSNKADINHTHSSYASSTHTHTGYASSYHSHSDYASSTHSHSNYASSSHSHTEYAGNYHTHSGYASSTHSHSIGSGGDPSHTHSMY